MEKRPRSLFAAFVIAVSMAAPLAAQDTVVHQSTTTPANARFEIVQSPRAARWTFRLDRFNGTVDMPATELPAPGVTPHFQIFLSGRLARHSLLMDTTTGKSWCLITVKRKRSDGTPYETDEWEPLTP